MKRNTKWKLWLKGSASVPASLGEKIQKHFHVSAKTYLRALQMNTGVSGLLRGEPIKEAAATACYKNVQHFTREFKFHVGVTPRTYLKTMHVGFR